MRTPSFEDRKENMSEHNLPKQGSQLLFVEDKAFLTEKIVTLDFSQAHAANIDRHVIISCIDGKSWPVRDVQAIEFLIKAFVPPIIQRRYEGQISVVRN